MKKHGILAILMAMVLSVPAFGQGTFAILFDGVLVGEKATFFPKKVSGAVNLNTMEPEKRFLPGVEVRFWQKSRVTLGLGYQKRYLKKDLEHHSLVAKFHSGSYFEDIKVSWDEFSGAEADLAHLSMYVNIINRGKVRPFIGVGGGCALFKAQKTTTNQKMEPMPNPRYFYFPPDWNKDIIRNETIVRGLAKAVAGLNVYPTKFLLLSIAGGHLGSPVFNFNVGFTF